MTTVSRPTLVSWSAGLALAACSTVALAAYPKGVTPGELALTPPFCQDVQTMNGWEQHVRESPRTAEWLSKMGKAFWGMHHYCWAQINTNRANAAGVPRQQRAHLLQTAIDDYVYVLNISSRDFVLRPEILYLIGQVHVMLEQYPQAVEAFNASKALKADYWPPYLAQAQVLEKLNKRAEARAEIESGLRAMPGEPTLLVHFRRLGGRVSDLPANTTVTSTSTPRSTPAPAAVQE
jgi:hypothetical protein